jgi:hypothetical protein
MEATQRPLRDEWANKMAVYIYNGVLFSFKKEGNHGTCYTMDEP